MGQIGDSEAGQPSDKASWPPISAWRRQARGHHKARSTNRPRRDRWFEFPIRAFDSVKAADEAIGGMGLAFQELPRPALFLAGRAFVKYRRKGGTRANVLADFFIGAHAAVLGCGILTRDAGRYRSYFPTVRLLTPGSA